MKNSSFLFLTALAILGVSSIPGAAQIVLTSSTVTPTPGPLDISNIVTAGAAPANGYSNSLGNKGVGESITIGDTPLALTSFAIKGGDSTSFAPPSTPWNIAVYEVAADNSLTLVTSATDILINQPNGLAWMTFSFTGANAVNLSADTEYAFQVSTSGTGGYFGFAQADNSSTPPPTGVDALSYNSTVPNSTTATGLNYNYVFDVGLTTASVPEPSTYALLLSGCAVMFLAVRRRNQSC